MNGEEKTLSEEMEGLSYRRKKALVKKRVEEAQERQREADEELARKKVLDEELARKKVLDEELARQKLLDEELARQLDAEGEGFDYPTQIDFDAAVLSLDNSARGGESAMTGLDTASASGGIFGYFGF